MHSQLKNRNGVRQINIGGVLLLNCMLLASCEKEEPLWKLPPAGNETVETIDLGTEYENVIFYQLGSGKKSVAALLSWDIAFATGAGEGHIIMNGGKDVQVYNTNDTDFAKTIYTTKPARWQWDNPNGDKDSTAVGAWYDAAGQVSFSKVYVFDLGKANLPRYKKVKFISVTADQYRIRVANLDNSDECETAVLKDATRNFIYFNLQSREPVIYEPASDQWDIVFTRYRHIYYDMDPVTPYLVNGVLINTKYIGIYESTSLKFEDINAEKAAALLLTRKADEIGFDWKTYNLDAGKYTVNPLQVFIIRNNEGYYYKLKFIDFYNEQGLKGYPRFVYQRL